MALTATTSGRMMKFLNINYFGDTDFSYSMQHLSDNCFLAPYGWFGLVELFTLKVNGPKRNAEKDDNLLDNRIHKP